MDNNNYVLWYKINKYSYWQPIRPNLPISEWENYAKQQEYAEYHISDYNTYDASQLHLTTNVVLYNGRYYLPEEETPYPKKESRYIGKFEFSMKLDEDDEDSREMDYEDVYLGVEQPWIDVITKFSANKRMHNLGIIPQWFVKDFSGFAERLNNKGHAVFINEEFSPFKWLAWVKDDKVRLIHQDYCNQEVKNIFDVLVDKEWFFSACKEIASTMQKYADMDLKNYQDYALQKYGKLIEKSIPYPNTEPLNLGNLEYKTVPDCNDESDFEDYYKTQDELWTAVYTYITLGDKTEEVVLIAEDFVDRFPFFLKELKNVENAVYDDFKYTETKLHAWLKGDKVRLFYQDYSDDDQEVIFDVMLDKDWFFDAAEKLINQMNELAISETERYKKYLKIKGVQCREEQ